MSSLILVTFLVQNFIPNFWRNWVTNILNWNDSQWEYIFFKLASANIGQHANVSISQIQLRKLKKRGPNMKVKSELFFGQVVLHDCCVVVVVVTYHSVVVTRGCQVAS